jgi:hypothetical protein
LVLVALLLLAAASVAAGASPPSEAARPPRAARTRALAALAVFAERQTAYETEERAEREIADARKRIRELRASQEEAEREHERDDARERMRALRGSQEEAERERERDDARERMQQLRGSQEEAERERERDDARERMRALRTVAEPARLPGLGVFPDLVSEERKRECLREFREAISLRANELLVCAVCGEQRTAAGLSDFGPADLPHRELLVDPDLHLPLAYEHDAAGELRGLVLEPAGLRVDGERRLLLRCCTECERDLRRARLPARSLANGLYLGAVPEQLRGLSLPETLFVSAVRVQTYLVRLRPIAGPGTGQSAIRGNAISFVQDSETAAAAVLPHTAADLEGYLQVVFTGAQPTAAQLARVLTVRRGAVAAALDWLVAHHARYRGIVVDRLRLAALPENGVPDQLRAAVTVIPDAASNAALGYAATSVVAEAVVAANGVDGLVRSGVIDVSGDTVAVDDLRRSALDGVLRIGRQEQPLTEWANPALWESGFPTLFVLGRAGAEAVRRTPLSLTEWARHLLMLGDDRFRRHPSFLFFVCNMQQRRAALHSVSARVRLPVFAAVAGQLGGITEDEVQQALQAMSAPGRLENANERVRGLLRQLRIVGSAVPGSQFARAALRTKITSLIVAEGFPLFFMTVNPADLHHPLLLLLAGQRLDLDTDAPDLPPLVERARVVASDPVAAARFFDTFVKAVLSSLVHVLGPVRAHFGTVEAQGRGSLHLHLLVWIDGYTSPTAIAARLKGYPDFAARVVRRIADTISESVPPSLWADDAAAPAAAPPDLSPSDASQPVDDAPAAAAARAGPRHPSTVLPPDPDDDDFDLLWPDDLRGLVLHMQMHRHSSSCYKYGSKQCRYRFERALQKLEAHLAEDGTIRLPRNHGLVNNYCPFILLGVRCNMDVQAIVRGADCRSLAFYVSDYITKQQLTTYQAMPLLAAVVRRWQQQPQGTAAELDTVTRVRQLLVRCINRLGAAVELSGPQAAALVLGLPDHYASARFRLLNPRPAVAYLVSTVNRPPARRLEDRGGDDGGSVVDSESDDETEGQGGVDVSLQRNADGSGFTAHAVLLDYLFRGPQLAHLSLYEYIERIDKEKTVTPPESPTRRGRPAHDRFPFMPQHGQHLTHTQRLRAPASHLVPQLSFLPPLQSSDPERYAQFVLAVFVPFDATTRRLEPSWADALHARIGRWPDRIASLVSNLDELQLGREEQRAEREAAHQERQANPAAPSDAPAVPGAEFDADDEAEAPVPDEDAELLAVLLEEAPAVAGAADEEEKDEYVRTAIAAADTAGRFAVSPSARSAVAAFGAGIVDAAPVVRAADADRLPAWQQQLKEQAERIAAQQAALFVDLPVDVRRTAATAATAARPVVSAADVAARMQLNPEQRAAFDLAVEALQASVAAGGSPEHPRLVYVGGRGGTGKSRVIDAVTTFASDVLRLEGAVQVLAFTGRAAANVHGSTIHAAAKLGNRRGGPRGVGARAAAAQRWQSVRMLIIDEISMVGCRLLARLHQHVGQARGTTDRPFGGLPVLFFGDMAQLTPVSDPPLYRPSSDALSAQGSALWTQLTDAVYLH